MLKNVLQILFIFLLFLLLQQCAQVGQLTGGKRDTIPPKLLKAIPANKSTGFNSNIITLEFDEFVKLKDLNNQFVVSPKLKTQPEVEVSGKSVVIHLKKEELHTNTTYRLYFGTAIVDMHESNSIENFDYVFSTGTSIDTLKIKGTVSNAFNNKPASSVLVGLYSASQVGDSITYKEIPDYVTRGSESGEFVFCNLPAQTFKAVAFTDKNKNSLYDGEAEKIAFMNSELRLNSDTSIHLNLFQEEPSKNYIKKTRHPYYGLAQIILNKKTKVTLWALKKENLPNISETLVGKEKDTVSFYYNDIHDTLGVILERSDSKKPDTLRLPLPRLPLPKDNSGKKRLKSIDANVSKGTLMLKEKVAFTFLNRMDTSRFDVSKIKISSNEDSLISEMPLKGRWQSITGFQLDNLLKEGINYSVKIDTTAFFDIKGFSNDSAKYNFKTKSKLEFGKVSLKMLFNEKRTYIVQLIKENEAVIKEQFVSLSLSSSNAVTINFIDVQPDTYLVKIIFDDNQNKKWDTGNWLEKKQPEKVVINSKQIKMLADWEMEEEIFVKE